MPVKAPDEKYIYDFVGWTPSVEVATADASYVATFEKRDRAYSITFLDDDGTELQTSLVPYGEIPDFELEDPFKLTDGKYYYWFSGWTPELRPATEEAVYMATYGKSPNYTLLATMKSGGKTKLNLTWTKVSKASGYDIFFCQCNSDGEIREPALVRTITGNKTFKHTLKGLKAGVCYKAYVMAFRKINGRKIYVAESPMVHAIANATNSEATNAKSITVNYSKLTLKKGKTKTLKAKVKGVSSKKGVLNLKHENLVRYFSTNTSVATVTAKGKVKAVGKGTCTVYVMTPNGIYKAVTVRVG